MTDDDLAAAWSRFAAQIPGYESPAAYGVGSVDLTGNIHFPHVNRGAHGLPAVVMASVCGHTTGTRSYEISVDELNGAIDLLAPAEAATHWDHPNLAAWRQLASNPNGKRLVAVFVGDLDDPPADTYDGALREALRPAP